MRVNGVSTVGSFASWVIYVPIGCRHPFMRYWHPSPRKTIATCSLQHPENELQWSINSFRYCISGNQGIACIIVLITELLTALIGKNPVYQRKNTDSKIFDIANCKTWKNLLLVVENAILIRHYSQTAKTRASYESIDGPADNRPNSNRLGVYNWTAPELTVQVHWRPRPRLWPQFGLDPDPDPKSRSKTIANTRKRHIDLPT